MTNPAAKKDGHYEYYVKRLGPNAFEVAKFPAGFGGDQPLVVYNVMYSPDGNLGKCDCPAATYRGTGKNDKHVKLVAEWVKNGDRWLPIEERTK